MDNLYSRSWQLFKKLSTLKILCVYSFYSFATPMPINQDQMQSFCDVEESQRPYFCPESISKLEETPLSSPDDLESLSEVSTVVNEQIIEPEVITRDQEATLPPPSPETLYRQDVAAPNVVVRPVGPGQIAEYDEDFQRPYPQARTLYPVNRDDNWVARNPAIFSHSRQPGAGFNFRAQGRFEHYYPYGNDGLSVCAAGLCDSPVSSGRYYSFNRYDGKGYGQVYPYNQYGNQSQFAPVAQPSALKTQGTISQ